MRLLLASPPSALHCSITSTSHPPYSARGRPLSLLPLSPLRRNKSNRMKDGDDLCIEKSMPRPRPSSPRAAAAGKSSSEAVVAPPPLGSKMNTVLFIETGEKWGLSFGVEGRRVSRLQISLNTLLNTNKKLKKASAATATAKTRPRPRRARAATRLSSTVFRRRAR